MRQKSFHRWLPGGWAWMLHRAAGVALALYLFVHLYVLSQLRDPERYGRMLELLHNPLVKLGEAALLALVVLHGINGLRLTALDLGQPSRLSRPLIWGSLALFLVLSALGGYLIAAPLLAGGGQG